MIKTGSLHTTTRSYNKYYTTLREIIFKMFFEIIFQTPDNRNNNHFLLLK